MSAKSRRFSKAEEYEALLKRFESPKDLQFRVRTFEYPSLEARLVVQKYGLRLATEMELKRGLCCKSCVFWGSKVTSYETLRKLDERHLAVKDWAEREDRLSPLVRCCGKLFLYTTWNKICDEFRSIE